MNVDTSRMRRSPPRRARRKKKKDTRDVFSRLYETNTESLAQSPWSPDGGNLIHVGGVGVNGVNSSYLSNNSSYSSDEEGNCFSVTSMRSMPATATALISPTSRLLKPTVASIHSMAQRKLDSLHLETSVTESEKPARDRIVKGPMKRRTPRPIQSTPPTIQHFHHSWHNVPPKVNSFNHRPAPSRRQHPVGENGINNNNIKNSNSNGLGHKNEKPQQRSSATFVRKPITRPKPKPTPQPKPTPTRKKSTATTPRPKAKTTTKTPPSNTSSRKTLNSPARKNTLSSPARTIATEASSLASATPSPLHGSGGAATRTMKDDPHNDSLCLDDVVANHDDDAAVTTTPAAAPAAPAAPAAATLDYAAVPQPLEDDEWPSQQVGVDLFRQKTNNNANANANHKLSRPDAEDALLEWYPTRLVHIALMAHEEELLQRNSSLDGATAAAASLAEDVDENDFVDLFLFVAYFHHLFDEFIFFDEEEDRRISRDEFVRVVVEQLGMTTETAQGAFDKLLVAGKHEDGDDLFDDGDGDGFCSFDDLCRFCVDRHEQIVQQKRGSGGGHVVDGEAAANAAAADTSAKEEEDLNAALASSLHNDDQEEEVVDKNSPASQEGDNNNNNTKTEEEEKEEEEAQHAKEDEERKRAGRKSEINLPRRSEMLRAFDFMDVEETGMVTRIEFEQFIREKGRPEWNNKEAIDLAFVALNPQSHHHEGSGLFHRDDFPFLLLYIVYHIHFKEKYTDFVKVDSSQSGDYGEMLVDSSSNHTTNTTTTTRQGVRVIPQGEFVLAGISVRLPNISQAYKVVKKTDEGQVLFHEFCAYCASKRLEGTESEDGNSNKG